MDANIHEMMPKKTEKKKIVFVRVDKALIYSAVKISEIINH